MSDPGSRLREFLAELRRRHVFRVAVAYAVVAFVVLQVVDIAFPALHLPDWTLTFVVLVAIFGFPIAMVLAWVFDITAEGVRRTEPSAGLDSRSAPGLSSRSLAFGAAVLVIAAAAVAGWFVLSKSLDWSVVTAKAPGVETAGADRLKIVVLPFENLGNPSEEYFAEGMTEEITARLASLQGLGVIARTSAAQYKGTDKRISEIGEELGVQYVLEGTVRWEYSEEGPNRVRVTPQLIRVSDGTHIWANIYEEPLASVFEVQSAIAEDVTEALDLQLREGERLTLASRTTDDVEAYQYFLLGRKYAESGATQLGGKEAMELYRRALEVDPDFEAAAQALAEAEADFYWSNRTRQLKSPDEDPQDRVRRLSLWSFGGDSAAYYLARANLFRRLEDEASAQAYYDSARAILEDSVEERPRSAAGRAKLGLAYAGLGRKEEAIREGMAAVELRPLAENPDAGDAWTTNLAHIYVLVGENEAAITLLEQLLEGRTRLSIAWLHADPAWDPIRDNPRFQDLLWREG